MGFLHNILGEDNDEILFFILVFLLIFNGGLGGSNCDGAIENGAVLFFIILFLLLFFSNQYDSEK